MLPEDEKNLVILVFDRKKGLALIEKKPPEITLYLEENRWTVRGFLFEIGHTDRGRLLYSDWQGPIGIYDRTNFDHLQEMVIQVQNFAVKYLASTTIVTAG
ncbi:MAG: hypothetical protein A2607_01920 [Candidatus Vogelbacteria bacterium RIFOXYD1_FULL_42_15]|uniref:Uncharacterized protein n=1 Tax=Candidatus Vogelbacteria bacterium RIFOXYD1_FULL_42_15 TaxID=1802437 RepID=A0A1G2QI69_9BACT|nr:MAG: hypothetical protein A2607_01920 [Candidatus Vogelbacteria bacterium RIFOXYD1_FULL_42_15]